MKWTDWALDRAWVIFTLIVVFSISTGFALTHFVVEPAQHRHLQDFKTACADEGGRYIKLDRRDYCIIDGAKIAR